MTFGEKLQNLRKLKNISQEQLAEQISVSRQAVSKWELGTSLPDTENVILLSHLFNVSTDYLLIDDIAFPKEELHSAADRYKPEAAYNIASSEALDGQSPLKSPRSKGMLVAEIILFCLGAVVILVLGILSSIFPKYISYPIEVGSSHGNLVKTGLPAFLELESLEWLFVLCCVLVVAVAGVWIIKYVKTIRKKYRKSKSIV